MPPRGPKPKPAGTSTRSRERPAHAPIAKLPPCPPHLAGEARKQWFKMGRLLARYGLISDIDTGAFAIYCQAWARWLEAEAQLQKFGSVIVSPNNYPIQSPWLAVANKAMDQMQRLLVEFGMSPSSRSRVTATPPAPPPRPNEDEEDEPIAAAAPRRDPRFTLLG